MEKVTRKLYTTTMPPFRIPPSLDQRIRVWAADNDMSLAQTMRKIIKEFLDREGGAQ